MADYIALSVRQPWATLIAHGLKRIEIRNWIRSHTGWVLIHASRIEDRHSASWRHVPDHLEQAVQRRGGIVGVARLATYRTYESRRLFAADRSLHLNPVSWFQPPRMFGLVFEDATPTPFHPAIGQLGLFRLRIRDRGWLRERITGR
jgi:hypothetical protein